MIGLPNCVDIQYDSMMQTTGSLLQEIACTGDSECCVVCHVAYEADIAGAALDEQLSSLARQYLATCFVRCVVQPGNRPCFQFGLPPGPGEQRCLQQGHHDTKEVCLTLAVVCL